MESLKSALHIPSHHNNDADGNEQQQQQQRNQQARPKRPRNHTWTCGLPFQHAQHSRSSSTNSNESKVEEDEECLLPSQPNVTFYDKSDTDTHATALDVNDNENDNGDGKKKYHRISMPPLGAEDIAQAVLRHRRRHNSLYMPKKTSLEEQQGVSGSEDVEASRLEEVAQMQRVMRVDWDETADR